MFRTRFAPSPTGYLHVGGARTALYCWLQAKKSGGQYLLRIEDTDRERSTDEAVQAILDSLTWLGIEAPEPPVFQTERFDRYAAVIQQLLQDGHAYHCLCTKDRLDELREQQRAAGEKPKYDGHCRDKGIHAEDALVVRFKTPLEGVTSFEDMIRGTLTFGNQELDDLVIRRSDGSPTYNLAVVVDDVDSAITHVIRGDDHINNTPKQVNIFNALSAAQPVFAHVPMILGEDGKRLSKRHGAVGVGEYQRQGFLPEALLNYLVRLGWSYGDKEIFTMEEMIEHFDVADVNRAASTFNHEKLLWLNQQHIAQTSDARIAELLAAELHTRDICCSAGPDLALVAEAYKDRARTIVELADSTSYLFCDFEQYDAKSAKKHLRPVVLESMTKLHQALEDLDDWQVKNIEETLDQVLQELDLKLPKLAQPLRVAITGSASSPSIGVTLLLTGKERTLNRMTRAMSYMEARAATA